jgi:hypothetical protein
MLVIMLFYFSVFLSFYVFFGELSWFILFSVQPRALSPRLSEFLEAKDKHIRLCFLSIHEASALNQASMAGHETLLPDLGTTCHMLCPIWRIYWPHTHIYPSPHTQLYLLSTYIYIHNYLNYIFYIH